jgi:hypothetical protein
MGKRKFFVDGADVDDFPRPTCLPKVTNHSLRHKKHALRLTIRTASKSFSVTSQKSARFSRPALLMRMSILPRVATPSSIISAHQRQSLRQLEKQPRAVLWR